MPKLPRIKRSRRKDNPEARMSIGDHLRELRQRLFVSAAGVMVMTVVGYLVYERAFALITRPIEQANAKGAHLTLNFDTILASFDMKLEVSIWLGILFSSPLWIYEFWAFVGPGMTRKEKAYTWAYGVTGLVLFSAGIALGMWIMPHAVVILTDDNRHSLAIAEVGQYDRRAQRYVTEQGYSVGVLLSSSNASTWTPHNNADLAFRLYAAEFTATEHTTELKTQTAHNTSDLYLMADVERPGTETDVSFTFVADDRRYALQDKQTGRLDVRTDGDLTAKVTLRGSKTRSPVLYPGALLALGDLQETATYISRAVVAGSGQAIVTLESNTPSGSALTVEIEIEGSWKSCTPENGEPLGDGWVRNEYKQTISGGDTVRCRITLSGNISARPRARALRMITT